jgi:hypothetical protein
MFRMFNWGSEKPGRGKSPKLADMDGSPLKEGDIVDCFRYDLGRCRLIRDDTGYIYESLESGKKVSWAKMVDARTKMQKVRKVVE